MSIDQVRIAPRAVLANSWAFGLFTTGYESSFPLVQEAVAQVIDPAEIRWVAFTESDLSERVRATMRLMPVSPLANYVPDTPNTDSILKNLADLKPRTLAIMHISSFAGDREHALGELSAAMRDVFGG